MVQSSRDIFKRLIAFASVSADSNLPITGGIEDHLLGLGFTCHRPADASAQNAGLFARIGPAGEPCFVNALQLVEDLIEALRAEQDYLMTDGAQALAYDMPSATVHTGKLSGFFAALGIAKVVCGPGPMNQGHQPDAFLAVEKLERCDAMLSCLVQSLSYQGEYLCR